MLDAEVRDRVSLLIPEGMEKQHGSREDYGENTERKKKRTHGKGSFRVEERDR